MLCQMVNPMRYWGGATRPPPEIIGMAFNKGDARTARPRRSGISLF